MYERILYRARSKTNIELEKAQSQMRYFLTRGNALKRLETDGARINDVESEVLK